jgi:hypothetical protein
MKFETSGGHILSTRWSWNPPFVPGEGPWFPLQKKAKLQKSDLWVIQGSYMGPKVGRGLKIPKIANISGQARNFQNPTFAMAGGS